MASRKKFSAVVAVVIGLVLSMSAGETPAAVVAGVNVPEEIVLEASGEKLVLNGAGVRKKLIIKVYAGALYLPARAGSVQEILDMPGGRRVIMHFLYKKVDAEKLVAGWNDGFAANLSVQDLTAVKERLGMFNALFQTVQSGDVYQLDLVPGRGTVVSLNGSKLGEVPGDDFYRALLQVWLGDKPADKGLKKAWLGK